MKKVIWIIVVLAAVGGGVWWWLSRPKGEAAPVAYKTVALSQGQATKTIRATGTIEPEDLIDIGAQITGQIMAFGTDVEGREVDYCSVVKKGQLLARIDDVTYKAEVTIAQATLASAKAQLASAKADVTQGTASLRQAERDWERAQKLGVGAALSQKDYDAYQSAYEIAAANLDVTKAQVEQANAAIAQAQAQLEKAERNLSYCDILSTVDGIVIDRRVNIGQTVTASMSTPSLFLVAKDLKKIEIWVPVNEADIGEIKVGQEVRFTVDAFPDKSFKGTVGRIRLNASMECLDDLERGDVHGGGDDGQPGRVAPALSDGERELRAGGVGTERAVGTGGGNAVETGRMDTPARIGGEGRHLCAG